MTPTDRAEINRANAQHSTGPKTEAGKQRISMNALKHGMTATSVVVPLQSLDAYRLHVERYMDKCQPEGPIETDLVQSLADTAWRQNRINDIEENLMFLPLDAQAKSIAAMSMHSQRLERQYDRTEKHLRELQELRRAQETEQLDQVLNIIEMHESKGESFNPSDHGFVFSEPEIASARRQRARTRLAAQALRAAAAA
jgi:hypothetical protein